MTRQRQGLGRRGEQLARDWLERSGYRILESNCRLQSGELDLVAEEGGELVFIEVKSRRGDAFGSALEAVDYRKQARLIRCAREYLARRRAHNRPARFDVVAVNFAGGKPAIEVVKNAFEL
ncbi:MAG: YraN family protein [Desulfurivibrio sp.]|nr:YraN family protein [Desulfurivibrio sp.]